MKIVIEYYVPHEYHTEEALDVSIIGNFTQWIPQPMEKVNASTFKYRYTALLERGFKHRYQFLVNGNEHIDEMKKTSVNFTGSKTNYIMVPLMSLEELHKGNISAFMCQDADSPALLDYPSFVPEELAKVMRSQSSTDDDPNKSGDIKEYVLSKMRECNDITEKKQYLSSKISETEGDKTLLQEQYRELDSEYCKIGLALKKAVTHRMCHTTGIDPTIYEIIEYISSQNSLKVRQVYDQNKILLDESSYGNYKLFGEEEVASQLKFMTIKQEASVRMEMMNDIHVFKIQYQIDEYNGERTCLPMSVRPNFIHLNEYFIDFDKLNGVIRGVSNNISGKVKFEAKQIDAGAGFIQNSTFRVWTNEINEQVYNIIHCHINDMSDSVPIATEYLAADETPQDYMKFDTDSAGQVLRYKILIKDHQILTVLYNSGASIEEIPFKEVKIDMNEPMLQAKIPDLFGEDPIIVKATKIPKSMTCAHDKRLLDSYHQETIEHEPLTHCRMRYFERLPGYIDVQMISGDGCNSLYQGEYNFSIPVCWCEPVDDMQKTLIASMRQFQHEQTMKGVTEAVETLDKLVEEYTSYQPKTLEEMKDAFQELKNSEERINGFIQGGVEDQDIIERAKTIVTKSSKLLRGMAAEMRMMSMRLNKS